MKYSILIILEEKSRNFLQFIENFEAIFSRRHAPFEILIIANGTGQFLKNELSTLFSRKKRLKVFEFSTKTTQAACLKAGIKESCGEIIIVCGSYQQITNDSIDKLIDALKESQVDMVIPWRQRRLDTPFNQLQSKTFNTLVKLITGSNFHDLSCRIRVARREVFEETELYGNMYRFFPILAERKGFKAKEIICDHYLVGGSPAFYKDIQKPADYLNRLIDIFVLYFNTRFTRKPLRFFSAVGGVFLLLGLIIAAYVFIQKVALGYPIGGRPALLLAVLFSVLGVQAASVGLLGEIIAFSHGRHKKEYTVEKEI